MSNVKRPKIEPCVFCGKAPVRWIYGELRCVNGRCVVTPSVSGTQAKGSGMRRWNAAMRRARGEK